MNPPSLLNAALRWFLLGMVVANIASEMVFAFLPVYLTRLGASVAEVGLVFSVASVVPLALQILGGWLSDSIGRLRTIALGALGGSLGYIGFVLAPSWEWVLLALGFEYISGSLVGPSYSAFIAEQSSANTRGQVFGIVNGIYLVVRVVGPALGGFLAGRYGFEVMLTAACVLYLSATALRVWMATTVRLSGEVKAQALTFESLRARLGAMAALVLSGSVLTWVFVTDGVRDVASQLSRDMVPIYFAQVGGLSVEQIGWLASAYSLATMLIAWPAGWIADKRGERQTIAAGFFLQFLGLAVFLLSQGFWGFATAVFTGGLGVGIMAPAYQSFISKVVPQDSRGIAFGLFESSLGVISLPAPWLGGQLWQRFSPRTLFAITAGALLVAILPVWTKFKIMPNC